MQEKMAQLAECDEGPFPLRQIGIDTNIGIIVVPNHYALELAQQRFFLYMDIVFPANSLEIAVAERSLVEAEIRLVLKLLQGLVQDSLLLRPAGLIL